MEYSDYLKNRMKDPEFKRLVCQERLIADAQEEISRLLEEKNVSKAELAKRLNKSKSFVTQLLNSGRNLTLRTIADVFTALGSEAIVKEKEKEVQKASDVYTFYQKQWETVCPSGKRV
jgi:transcriptional regulator with XRE-family HTH domain